MIKRWAARAAVAAVGACGLLSACGGSDDGTVPPGADGGEDGNAAADGAPSHACVPGQQVSCACPGGPRGAQTCNAQGTGYGVCVGCDVDATVPDDASTHDDGSAGDDAADAADANTPSDGNTSDGGTDGPSDGAADAHDGAIHDASLEAAPDGAACVSVPAARAPVFMLFALDGSGSMADANKWVAATGAVDAVFTDMKSKGDPGLGAGLNVFSDSQDPTCGISGLGGCTGPYPSSVDVPIAFVDATQLGKLTGRTSASSPTGDTPTGAILTGSYGELASFSPGAPLPPNGKKVLVLITDGVPTDECAPVADGGAVDYTQNVCVQRAAKALATVGPAGSVETFVVGVGTLPGDFTSYDPYFLGALAKAGGTAPAGCNPQSNAAAATDRCYFNIDPAGSASTTQTALEAALDAIRGQVATCDVPINLGAAGPLDPGNFNVEVGGSVIPEGPNGWTFDNLLTPSKVILHGAACATITGAPTTKIDFVVGCPTVTQ